MMNSVSTSSSLQQQSQSYPNSSSLSNLVNGTSTLPKSQTQPNILASSSPPTGAAPISVGNGIQSPLFFSPPSTPSLQPSTSQQEFHLVTSTSSTPSGTIKKDLKDSKGGKLDADVTTGRSRSQSDDLKQSSDNSILKESSDKLKKKAFLSPKLLAPSKKNTIGGEEPPISKTLDSRMKSNPYIKKFKLPSTELLINDYSAALYRQILLHGRLYLFTNYICFESKIFGIKTTEIIQFNQVTSIKKKSKKFQFPVGIEIIANNNKLSFASFVSRDKTFNELMSQWKEVTGESHDEVSSQSIDDDEDDSSNNSVFETESLNGSGANGSIGSSSGSSGSHGNHSEQSTQSSGFQQTANFSQDLVNNNNQNNNNNNNNTSATPTTTNGSTTNNSAEQQQQQQTNHVSNQQPTDNCNNINQANNIESSSTMVATTSSTVVVQKVEEKSVFEELYGNIEQYLSQKEQSSILESQSSEFEELLTDNFNCSTANFFRALCSDKCNFAFTYHTKRGDKNITVKNWTQRERFGTVRELEYVAPVNSPIGPDKTRIQETQRYHLTPKKLIIETDTIMLDIPYGDHFRIEAIWEVVETSPETCRLTIQICVRFIKKTWFKSKIETSTIKESKGSFQTWVQLAKQEVQKAMQFKRPTSNNIAAPSTVGGAALPSINISNLNRSIEKIRGDEGGISSGEGRIDSPKPHHTRSRSRQHLVSSSNQINNNNGSDNNSPFSAIQQQQQQVQTQLSLPPIQNTLSPINLGGHNNNAHHHHSASTNSPLTSIKEGDEDVTLSKKRSPVRLQVTSDYGDLSITGYPMISVLVLLFSLYLYMYLKINSLSTQVGTLENLLSHIIINNNNHNNQLQQSQNNNHDGHHEYE